MRRCFFCGSAGFNPPSPCGEGPPQFTIAYSNSVFQSTLPVWGGTLYFLPGISCFSKCFNPPSPCGEGLSTSTFCISPCCSFNPPSPCGEGPGMPETVIKIDMFQSTLPVWGGTLGAWDVEHHIEVSIHPPRVGRDLAPRKRWKPNRGFNPPSPCGEGLCRAFCPGRYHPVSIHPPRMGRDFGPGNTVCHHPVSIHPPRVGRDRAKSV